jgi:hypothetical protein
MPEPADQEGGRASRAMLIEAAAAGTLPAHLLNLTP